jgi:hypothetical protein
MILSDLTYLENTADEVVGGRGFTTNTSIILNKKVTADVNENYFKKVATDLSGLTGNVSEVTGNADANAGGNECRPTFSSIVFSAQSEPGSSGSFVNAIAVVGPC